MILFIVLAAGWAICAFLTYGLAFAFLQRTFDLGPTWIPHDRRLATQMAVMGPIGLIVLLMEGRNLRGFKWL